MVQINVPSASFVNLILISYQSMVLWLIYHDETKNWIVFASSSTLLGIWTIVAGLSKSGSSILSGILVVLGLVEIGIGVSSVYFHKVNGNETALKNLLYVNIGLTLFIAIMSLIFMFKTRTFDETKTDDLPEVKKIKEECEKKMTELIHNLKRKCDTDIAQVSRTMSRSSDVYP